MKLHFRRYWPDVMRIATAFILGVILIIVINGLGRSINLSKQNQRLGEQIKQLSNQTKQLSMDNKELAMQNQTYIKCVATIFAKFTQDGQAIHIEDLDNCAVAEDSKPPTKLSPAQTDSKTSLKNSSQNSTSQSTNQNTNQSSSSNGGNDKPSDPGLVEKTLDGVNRDVVKPVVNFVKGIF